jgi:hypothetical protein
MLPISAAAATSVVNVFMSLLLGEKSCRWDGHVKQQRAEKRVPGTRASDLK